MPYSKWFGCKPDLGHACTFSCLAYMLVLADRHSIFELHYIKCIFIGYSDKKLGCWTFYKPTKHVIFESTQGVFDEDVFPGNGSGIISLDPPALPSQVPVSQDHRSTPGLRSQPIPDPDKPGPRSAGSRLTGC